MFESANLDHRIGKDAFQREDATFTRTRFRRFPMRSASAR